MAIWQAIPSSRNKKGMHNFEGGLNTGLPSFDVNDDEYISGFGWSSREHPALASRKGRTSYGSSGSGITRLLTNFGNIHLVRATGTGLQYNSSGTTWSNISGTFTNTDWDATNFDVNGAALILTNGADNVKVWDGTSLADLNASDSPKGKYIASDNRRVYIANADGDDSGDIIHYCAFQDATDWTTAENSGAVQYYTSNGGAITALIAFEGRIWAFKKDAFCLIFHTGDARSTHRLVEASNDIGCDSFKTLKEVGARLFWKGPTDVYMGAGGGAIAIGEPIREYLDDVNEAYADKCWGATDGIRYFLGLVTGSATEPNLILSYDPRKGRQRWDVHSQMINLRYAAQLNNAWYVGNTTGQTYKMDSDTDDDGTAVTWEVETKDFDEGEPEAEKEYYELHVQFTAVTGTTLTVQASVDQGETYFTIGDPITTDTVAQNENIIIPLDVVPLGNWIRFKLSGSGQFVLNQLQRYFRVQPIMH